MLIVLPLWDSVIILCFVMLYFMSILLLQSSWWRRESWLLCLVCLPGVSWLLCGSSLQCHRFVCSLDFGISWSNSLFLTAPRLHLLAIRAYFSLKFYLLVYLIPLPYELVLQSLNWEEYISHDMWFTTMWHFNMKTQTSLCSLLLSLEIPNAILSLAQQS